MTTPIPPADSLSTNDSAPASQNQLAPAPAPAASPPSASFGPSSSPSSPLPPPPSSTTTNTPLSTISPAHFDIVPALHQLLSRLLPATPPSVSMAPPYHQSHSYTGTTPLDIPGLTPATSGLMVKLQHARAAIRALPDIDRTMDEQMMEISFLTERVEKLKGLLKDIREECVVGGVGEGEGDHQMEGTMAEA